MKERYKWLVIILWAFYITTLSVPIHESVHVYQCRSEGGNASFVWAYSKGYDFLNFSWADAIPSPAVRCMGGFDQSKGDWYYEAPAFFYAGIYQFGFTIIFALVLVKWEKSNNRNHKGKRKYRHNQHEVKH